MRRNIAAASMGLGEPLIPKPETRTEALNQAADGDDNATEIDSNQKEITGGNFVATSAVCVLAAAGFAASAAAMVSTQAIMVFVAGGICCANAPTLVHRHHKLSNASNMRKSIGQLRDQVNELSSAIDFLHKTIGKLENEVDDVKFVEEQLRLIVNEQGGNVENLVELVRENETILDAMKGNLRQSFVAEMAKIILRSDKDGDMHIDESEFEALIIRLQIQLQPHGIELDTVKFQQVLEEDSDVANLLKFCSEVLYPEIALSKSSKGHEGSVVSGYESDDLSSKEDDVFAAAPAAKTAIEPDSFAKFCRKLSMMSGSQLELECDVKMAIEDKLDIFKVNKRYSGGSVEVARGRKMSIVPGAQVKKKHARVSRMAVEAQKISSRASHNRKTLGMAEF